jgi:hypothetical protein
MVNLLKNILYLALLTILTSCLIRPEPKATFSDLLVSRGDIVVSSANSTFSDSLVVFSPNGTFKRVLYELPNPSSESIGGLSWLPSTNEILINIEGGSSSGDRIEAFNVINGTVRTFYNNTSNYSGTGITAIAVLENTGDVIANEGSVIERFSSRGIRETWTTIWPTSVIANTQQLVPLKNGNWLACSSSAGLRISPDSTTDLTAVATATSAIVATTQSYGCGQLSDGTIVVAWNGTSDAIQTYTSTLTSPTTLISNSSVLSNPRGIAIGENDEIYVSDNTRNMVIELDIDGNVTREFGSSYIVAPSSLLVIPSFN